MGVEDEERRMVMAERRTEEVMIPMKYDLILDVRVETMGDIDHVAAHPRTSYYPQ